MKVINYGEVKPKELTCKGCSSQLEYTPYDVKFHSKRFKVYNYVVCPVCGKWCYVNDEGDAI